MTPSYSRSPTIKIDLLIAAAASIPPEEREGFLRAVAAGLSAAPSDDGVRRSIAEALLGPSQPSLGRAEVREVLAGIGSGGM